MLQIPQFLEEHIFLKKYKAYFGFPRSHISRTLQLVEIHVQLQQTHVDNRLIIIVETDTERSINIWFHLGYNSIHLDVVEHEVTTIGAHTVVVHLQPIALILVIGGELEIELLPHHMVGIVAATIHASTVSNITTR